MVACEHHKSLWKSKLGMVFKSSKDSVVGLLSLQYALSRFVDFYHI